MSIIQNCRALAEQRKKVKSNDSRIVLLDEFNIRVGEFVRAVSPNKNMAIAQAMREVAGSLGRECAGFKVDRQHLKNGSQAALNAKLQGEDFLDDLMGACVFGEEYSRQVQPGHATHLDTNEKLVAARLIDLMKVADRKAGLSFVEVKAIFSGKGHLAVEFYKALEAMDSYDNSKCSLVNNSGFFARAKDMKLGA